MAARRKSTLAGGQVLVVNMIPRSLSRETNQDSEPSITVNPANAAVFHVFITVLLGVKRPQQ